MGLSAPQCDDPLLVGLAHRAGGFGNGSAGSSIGIGEG